MEQANRPISDGISSCRQAGQISPWKLGLLRFFVAAGFLALAYYASWWFEDERWQSPLLLFVFALALLYAGTQIVGNWVLYLFAHRPSGPPPFPKDLTVDVFLTVYHEPFDLIEHALRAACEMRGEHRTWLLDDGSDPNLEALASRLGAGYLTRVGHQDAKAGNVNAALKKTEGEVVVIFDVDHIPDPNFLECSLGYFSHPQMGFVQVMLTFDNGRESWVAQAAIETSLEYYNPASLGSDGVGGATLMGSNALIRRKALEAIGGYQPGLAEDLATSIHLHAAGWKSAYVAQPLAPGLAPPSFSAWFIQQLKWARGVFELLITAFPPLFPRLTWGQRLSYSVRMTKYWIGPAVGVHLFATIVILIFGSFDTRAAFHDYLIHITPLAFADVLNRHIALRLYRHHAVPRTSLLKAVSLVYATWPIYLLAWTMSILRLPLPFMSTPKSAENKLRLHWLFPQIIALLLLVGGTYYTVWVKGHSVSILLLFAILQAGLQLIVFIQWLYSDTRLKRILLKSLHRPESKAVYTSVSRHK